MSEKSKELLNEKQEDQVKRDENMGFLHEKRDRLLRLKEVLEIVPISKSTWWAGCASGRFPKPVHLGPRVTCWRESEVMSLVTRED